MTDKTPITVLEPEARALAYVAQGTRVPAAELPPLFSIAISLKRIADGIDACTTDSRFGIGFRVVTNGDDQ